MITTRNRAADLAATLTALESLEPRPSEILVTLDGCGDDSASLLHTRFPDVRVITHDPGRGSIPSRDEMMRAAKSDLVLSLDDDSYPLQRDFLARASELFAANPRLAVVTFPQRSEEFPASLNQRDFGVDEHVGTFTSSGAMLRRATYLACGGYAPIFQHVYEEPDYALLCIATGAEVRRHVGLTVRHHYSARNRNEIRTHQLHARNEQWSILLRCPSPWWPLIALRRAAGQLWYAAKRGPRWLIREPLWWWAALVNAPRVWRLRCPVSLNAYRRWMRLLRNPEPIA